MTRVEEVVIANGDVRLTVLPSLGARMHSLRVRGHELLRSPKDAAEHAANPFFWGGYVMAPWCNRLVPGLVTVGAKEVDLRPNFRDGTAIHGQVYVAPWQQRTDDSFVAEGGGAGWPWPYRVEADYGVSDGSVSITLRLRNLSDDQMPGGIGIHPWFPWPVEARIDCALTYGPNDSPNAQPVPVSGDVDVRARQALAAGVDSTWTQAGDPPVELWWPSLGLHAQMHAPVPDLHVTAANAADVQAIAVEPQTHAPQGLSRLLNNEPGALAWIAPGDELTLPITIDLDWTR
jgi:aldose 1-epimerase